MAPSENALDRGPGRKSPILSSSRQFCWRRFLRAKCLGERTSRFDADELISVRISSRFPQFRRGWNSRCDIEIETCTSKPVRC